MDPRCHRNQAPKIAVVNRFGLRHVRGSVTRHRDHLPLAGLLNLSVIYVVWGSTYLAIRVAVREGAGWGPFWLGASRVFVAAAILLLLAAARRARIRPSRRELAVVAVSGLLMWVGGNGGVIWAEQRVDSGLAALIVGARKAICRLPIERASLNGAIAITPLTLGSRAAY